MLLTPHTLVGIAIATLIPNPYISVPVALGSHFLGDLMPHWDFFTYTKREERGHGWKLLGVVADTVIGTAVGLSLTLYVLWVLKNPGLSLNIFLCGIAAVLPDILTGPSIYVSNPPKLFRLVHNLQSKMQNSAGPLLGNLTQTVVALVAFWVIASTLGF